MNRRVRLKPRRRVTCRHRSPDAREERREMPAHADRAHARPPPPCGMQNVLCRLRWLTIGAVIGGRDSPTCAFMLAPSR